MSDAPADWTAAALEDIVDRSRPIVYGILMPGADVESGVPVVKVKDIKNDAIAEDSLLRTDPRIDQEYRRSRLSGGDLLFTIRGTVGRMAFVPASLSNANITQDTARIAISGANPRFVRHYLALPGPQEFIDLHTLGLAVKGINLRDVRRIPVRLPPRAEQDALTEILDTVDEVTWSTERLIAKLDLLKQGLLHDLLTRGIDDNGDLRDPDRRPDEFVTTIDGSVPRAWVVCALRDVVPKVEYGISSPLGYGDGTPVLRMNNIAHGEARLNDVKSTTLRVPPTLLLRYGDVLFNRTNSIDHVGRTGIWRGQIPGATFASYLVRLGNDPHRLQNEYLNRWLNFRPTQIRIRRYATPGVHQVNINPTNLRRVMIALPGSMDEQGEITRRLNGMDQEVDAERSQLAKLKLLRAGLMDELLTGRVRVSTADPTAAS